MDEGFTDRRLWRRGDWSDLLIAAAPDILDLSSFISKIKHMNEYAAEFKKALQERERVIVYTDVDMSPNTLFLSNSSIMSDCEELLGEDYTVIYAWQHLAAHNDLCDLIYDYNDVCEYTFPQIILFKNGIEIARSNETFHEFSYEGMREAPVKLANWIKEQFN